MGGRGSAPQLPGQTVLIQGKDSSCVNQLTLNCQDSMYSGYELESIALVFLLGQLGFPRTDEVGETKAWSMGGARPQPILSRPSTPASRLVSPDQRW